jgi:hypothetical protein
MAANGKRISVAAKRPAENDDHRVLADEHVQIAAHEHHEGDDEHASQQPQTRGNIHGQPHAHAYARPRCFAALTAN